MMIKLNELTELFKATASLMAAITMLIGLTFGAVGVHEIDKMEDHMKNMSQEIDKMEDLQKIAQLHNISLHNPTYPEQYSLPASETPQPLPKPPMMQQQASAPQKP
ncbi:hypothetical protein [Alysiella filiformis]|uniref:Uncharacterized protein n=1 Tax=Alysiella filiformis DSM 16848 TaxID=1120981 RepID=A0A286EBS9_9NEIS|nr:hypothetical protein [Alysiella filiformis]QMT31331.1 hypothetical protein H3L97_11700 [Alysiella filiformis]UBQ55663.1 hypothetical protein JF568_08765 [Alysiella filiformis DSM 16848]SOD68371.1 hypothetical protein SAMN02746062_01232 [Alysiella filiformis DSM 16848]